VRSRDHLPTRRQRPDHGTGPSGPHRPATANYARRVVSIGRSAVQTPLPAPDAVTGAPAPTTGPPSRLTSPLGNRASAARIRDASSPDVPARTHTTAPPGPVASSRLAEPLSTYRRLPAPRPPRGADDHDALRLALAHRRSSQARQTSGTPQGWLRPARQRTSASKVHANGPVVISRCVKGRWSAADAPLLGGVPGR
jgi:hypothetical protein